MRKKSTSKDFDEPQDDHSDSGGSPRRRFTNLPENYYEDEYEEIDSFYTAEDYLDDDGLEREPGLEEINPNLDEEDLAFDADEDEEF
ncbi:MAG: hypothetical protein N2110_07275 [Flavobacteriales bacterium]|nr:hypothetical protein [Flavobacteriales bacterium]MCX7768805.1 hypothetical protein [Flavobacteriales bacterium]MDW8410666.1 hypothetical protein [Flavobacteriales bacterium]